LDRTPPRRPATAIDAATRRLAAAVRDACLRAALEAHEQAGLGGLCAEGRWEVAVDAIRSLDVDAVVEDAGGDR